MEQNRNSFSNIFKAIGLFGGVKIFQIIVNILKSKVVALLIGPAGMGIIGLLQSSVEVVNQVTGCGLQTSAVREVSKSYSEKDDNKIGVVISTLHKLVWLTGIIGTLVVFFFSAPLSSFAFGNEDHSIDFKYVSIVLLLMQLNVGQIALLQGTFRYRDMAKASLYGSALGLIAVCPLYYFFREDGIVPSLIIAATITLFFSWIYSKRINYNKIPLTPKSFLKNSKNMVTLGFVLALGLTMSTASGYLMNIFLSYKGDATIVGLYHAAYQIANSYVLLVLSSMSADYIPRLSAMNGQREAQIDAINKQAVMVVIIIAPLLAVLMVFSREVVLLLYSSAFTSISILISLLMFGMIFRSISWCMAYSLIARGDSKAFLISETLASITSLTFKIVGYLLGGFVGMGIGFVINYVVYTIILYLITKKIFLFSFSRELSWVFLRGQSLITLCLVVCVIPWGAIAKYCVGTVVIILTGVFSYFELKKRISIGSLLHSIKRK